MGTATAEPNNFLVKLKSRNEVAEHTMAFRFEKPEGWTFKAGQTIDMTLIDPPETDSEGNTRTFTIASAPHEETLIIATRMRNTAFKRTLKTLPLGRPVKIEGPFGNLILHNNPAKTAVLLAGGIGITPFRSIVVRAAKEKLPHRIFLFYSNRRPEDAAFLEELQALQAQNPNYTLVATMTEIEKSNRAWMGETGLLTPLMLSKYLKGAAAPIYYIAGSPGMVKGLHEVLNKQGVDDDDIRTEDFAGY
jgi:ferredoxin-NADP reductase